MNNEEVKKFAEENKGKKFRLYGGATTELLGYCEECLIVTNKYGWSEIDINDVLLVRVPENERMVYCSPKSLILIPEEQPEQSLADYNRENVKVGDTIEVVDNNGDEEYYNIGDKGVVLNVESLTIYTDFSQNEVVQADGHWSVEFYQFKIINNQTKEAPMEEKAQAVTGIVSLLESQKERILKAGEHLKKQFPDIMTVGVDTRSNGKLGTTVVLQNGVAAKVYKSDDDEFEAYSAVIHARDKAIKKATRVKEEELREANALVDAEKGRQEALRDAEKLTGRRLIMGYLRW
jgi:hypothetical protein